MVNVPNSEYLEWSPLWKMLRDVVKGEYAVKAERELYLPRPGGQTDQDYTQYIQRAHWFDGTSRTAETYWGNLFSKEPIQNGNVSAAFGKMQENVDGAGNDLRQFADNCTFDALQTYWGGILVDYPFVPSGTPQAIINGSAFLKWYTAEAVINWRREVRNGKTQTVLVVLREDSTITLKSDYFLTQTIERYRVLMLDKEGKYVQRIYSASSNFESYEEYYPKINNAFLYEIPFFFCPFEDPSKSLLLGLAYENIGVYQLDADYKNGLHFTGVPTPIVENMSAPIGKDGKPMPVKLGGSVMQFFKDDQQSVNVKYLEFTGAGLSQISAAIDSSIYRMALLGARALGADKKGVESAETIRVYRASENGVLRAFARAMSEKLTSAIQLMALWNGEDVSGWSYFLNTDYDDLNANAQMIQTLLVGRTNNEVPRYSVYKVLKEAEMIPEQWEYEDFLSDLDNSTSLPKILDGE
jgi:hypothetical protein